MRLLQTLPGFNSVGPNQKAESNLPIGPTIDGIFLEVTAAHSTISSGAAVLQTLAQLATHVAYINVIADDSRIIRRITPALLSYYLNRKNLARCLVDSAGTVIKSAYIPFADPTRPQVEGQDATALGTLGTATFFGDNLRRAVFGRTMMGALANTMPDTTPKKAQVSHIRIQERSVCSGGSGFGWSGCGGDINLRVAPDYKNAGLLQNLLRASCPSCIVRVLPEHDSAALRHRTSRVRPG